MLCFQPLLMQLKHRKGQLKANLHDKPVSTAPDIAHEKVQEMDLG